MQECTQECSGMSERWICTLFSLGKKGLDCLHCFLVQPEAAAAETGVPQPQQPGPGRASRWRVETSQTAWKRDSGDNGCLLSAKGRRASCQRPIETDGRAGYGPGLIRIDRDAVDNSESSSIRTPRALTTTRPGPFATIEAEGSGSRSLSTSAVRARPPCHGLSGGPGAGERERETGSTRSQGEGRGESAGSGQRAAGSGQRAAGSEQKDRPGLWIESISVGGLWALRWMAQALETFTVSASPRTSVAAAGCCWLLLAGGGGRERYAARACWGMW
ncbi:hypothetical protein K490DRAFT_57875 [Saccharata proteae CBS 121410]|uniref:Uncharacterized protein n=1 Tax=Saccharata proteae CBS 121410 TaxID=1314787 RepID=A0A9P4LYR5_9PEZI|nr:hypothetical protein K490DRAFT_57875 [Saccharata proteae CBS 121410]